MLAHPVEADSPLAVSETSFERRICTICGRRSTAIISRPRFVCGGTEGGGRPAERSFLEAKLRVGARRRKVRLETAFSGTWLTRTALHDQALRRIPQELRPLGVPVPSQLRPVLRIRYTRGRFVDPLAGVRISLDADISAPAVNRKLLSVPNPLPLDTAVVEVKGQARELPTVIRHLTDLGGRKRSFCKYRACYEHTAIGPAWRAGTQG